MAKAMLTNTDALGNTREIQLREIMRVSNWGFPDGSPKYIFTVCFFLVFSPSMTRVLGFPPRNKKEADVQMQAPIPDLIHHFGNQDLAFLLRPAKDFADEAEGVGLDAHGHVFALVAADFLHLGIFGPGTDWDL
jgi:hypothetical protein